MVPLRIGNVDGAKLSEPYYYRMFTVPETLHMGRLMR